MYSPLTQVLGIVYRTISAYLKLKKDRLAYRGVHVSIEEPELIERILTHRRERGEEAAPTASLGARAPPQASLF